MSKVDLNKHAEAMLEAFDCHVFGDTLEAYWERRRAAILTACAALADDARKKAEADAARYRWLRDDSCPPHNFYVSVPDKFHGVKYAPADVDAYIDAAIRAIDPASLRGEKL